MTGARIVCLAPTEWDGAWQRYHEIARRLAADGNRVLVVDGAYRLRLPALRSMRDVLDVAARGAALVRRTRRAPSVSVPDVRVHTIARAPRSDAGAARLASRVRAEVDALGDGPVVLWCSYPTPLWRAFDEALDPDVVWYDCASAFADDPLVPEDVRHAERDLIARAGAVTVDARALYDRHARHARTCEWIPTGVDTALFARACALRALLPTRERRVLGYVGTLHSWLDVPLIAGVARAHPDWRLRLIGPRRIRTDLSALQTIPNVECVGALAHDRLPGALAEVDVAWIPYIITPFTAAVFPTKLLEYLAAGCAVVSTPLAEVRPFVPPVRLAATVDDTAAAVCAALADPRTDDARHIAAPYDWNAAMAAVHAVLDGAGPA